MLRLIGKGKSTCFMESGNFKTSYVTVNQKPYWGGNAVIKISKHLMLRLIP